MQKISPYFKKLLDHPLTKGSLVVFGGSLLANFLNYLFHLLTGRMLGPERYATIASLISLFYVISFPSSIISTIVARKVAQLSARNDLISIKSVFKFLLKNIFYFNLAIVLGFFIFQAPIAQFLKIKDSFLVFLLGLSFALSLFSVVGSATLQGLLKFFSFSFIAAFVAFLRDVLAVLAIILGLDVLGVLWGMVFTNLVGFLLVLSFLKFIFREREVKKSFPLKTYLATLWVVAALFGMSLMINVDVMLVKHFFSSFEAGLYAALATMGKVVFFASSSVSTVLLPLASQKREAGGSVKKELRLSQFLVFLLSFCLTVVYFSIPKLIINLFYGPNYYSVMPYLGLIGVYFLFYNLSYLFVNFFVSLQKKKILLIPLFYAFLQVVLIFLFHQSFYQVLYILIATAALLFFSFSLYYLRYGKEKL